MFNFFIFLLYDIDLTIPLAYSGDALLNSMWIKSIIDHGWYLHNDSVGAPFGLDMNDYAMSDNLHLLFIKIISLFSSNYALVMNLYYLLTYPITVVTSLIVLRHFKLSCPTASAASLIYAFLPYHFMRGEGHLFLASYYLVPFLFMIIIWALENNWTRKKSSYLHLLFLLHPLQGYTTLFYMFLFSICSIIFVI